LIKKLKGEKLKKTYLNSVLKLSMGILVSSSSLYATDYETAKNIMDTKCIACHTGNTSSGLSRISDQRKTPEGWIMTLKRMKEDHGLFLTKEENEKVIKYLSDTQGLNYDETSGYRYILEKTPNYQENTNLDGQFTEVCARCHSAARVTLQKRTKAEWDKLVDFHLGKFPTTEYQSLARDRDWYGIAKKQIVPYLADRFDNDKEFKLLKHDFSGSWSFYGHRLGEGDFSFTMDIKKVSDDKYKLLIDGSYIDGREIKGLGYSNIYSGYEYRGIVKINGIKHKQIFSFDTKSGKLSGSMFETLHPEEHSYLSGVKKGTKSTILGVYPKSIKAGTSNIITIVGSDLSGSIKLSKALKINKIIEKSASKIILDVSASSKYSSKSIDIKVGQALLDDALVVYKKLDGLKVYPSYAIARVGDGGGKMPKQHAVFEAHGYLAGKDGKIDTADDISLGKVDAKWSVAPFDERAKIDEDVKFTGDMDSYSGRFTPSFAGPNPKRRFGTNNAGNLKVIATYKDGTNTLKADSHLIVTVQKWVNPPID